MKLQSLISQGWDLFPIEVEVLLVRGLPELKFVGLPDQAIKESAIRIKTAIKQSGFSWPEAEQIIVNLKPNHLKKSSRGLELAVAAGILWETQQVPIPTEARSWTLYGELNLDGSVQQPDDLLLVRDTESQILISGIPHSNAHRPWLHNPLGRITHLRYINEPEWKLDHPAPQLSPPDFSEIYLTSNQAELAQIASWGQHSLLMAGPAGSGKSLMGEVIHSLGDDPTIEMQKELWRRRLQAPELANSSMLWRPLIRPHHSVTPQGLVGGGNPIRPGELARAHHGTLILDELLEFKPTVVESLREPLETNKIRLARASGYYTYDCNFHFLATTNLCPCGDFVPKTPTRCRYSLTKCRSYSQKLTGPLVDRFQMLSFSHRWKGDRSINCQEIKQKLTELRAKQNSQYPPNAALPEASFDISTWPLLERKLLEQLKGSHRRYLATLRISKTIAELNGRIRPNLDDIEKTLTLTVTPFVELQRWD
jgi:magnesium chelatase family protein